MTLQAVMRQLQMLRDRLIARYGPRPLALGVEGGMVLLVYFGYTITKGLIHDAPYTTALGNAWRIVVLELNLKVFHEQTLQRWFLDHAPFFVQVFNWFYTIGYWPIILPIAFIAWWRAPALYREFRTVALFAMLLSLVAYAVFPLAPPRMLDGFVDTISAPNNTAFGHAQYALYANEYAAMPSVHYGLALLMAILMFRTGKVALQALAFCYQGLMLLTIVVTANHYFLDAFFAVVVLGLAWSLYWVKERMPAPRILSEPAGVKSGT